MSAEIGLLGDQYGGPGPVYAVAYALGTTDYVLQATGATEAYRAADWPLYVIPLARAVDGNWYGNWPATGTGQFIVELYAQVGSTPAPTDTDLAAGGEFDWYAAPQVLSGQMPIDAMAMMADFGEQVTYKSYNDANALITTTTLTAVVDRQPPEIVTEDGKVLTDDMQVCIAAQQLPTVNPRRDKISVAGRYGGAVTDHVVTIVLGSDGGVWTLRIR